MTTETSKHIQYTFTVEDIETLKEVRDALYSAHFNSDDAEEMAYYYEAIHKLDTIIEKQKPVDVDACARAAYESQLGLHTGQMPWKILVDKSSDTADKYHAIAKACLRAAGVGV